MMMNNFVRNVGRSIFVGPFAVVGVNIHYNKLERGSFTIFPSSSKEASGAVLDDLSKAEACGPFDRDTIANAAAKAGPAVVRLDVNQYSFRLGTLYDIYIWMAYGSGTIINKDGTILTCAHVVAGSPRDQIQVTLQDGRAFEGKVVYADLQSDIAIVKINSKSPLPEAKLGSSSRLRTGDWVMAMGAPHSIQNSVSAGIVSWVNRKIAEKGTPPREYIQTDCVVTKGNSGGPLVNMDGEVVGVVVLSVEVVNGFSFSVPIDSVVKVIEHLKKSGKYGKTRKGNFLQFRMRH